MLSRATFECEFPDVFGSRELVSQIFCVRRTGSIVLEPDVEMLHFEENKVSKEFGNKQLSVILAQC